MFGEGDSVLARYATRFPVVEINSSFYRSHRQGTYVRWAASVPDGFRFSVKLPKAISHEMALRGTGALIDQFLGETSGLGPKLGAMLLQLPPSHQFDRRVASTFFTMVRRRTNALLACEPRHPSWFSLQATELFARYGVTRVTADPQILEARDLPGPPGSALYWRLHGTPRVYYSAYSEEVLQALARDVIKRRIAMPRPWVIFDNTAHGFSVANAARLQDILLSHRLGKTGAAHA